jgi:hypothetical protein
MDLLVEQSRDVDDLVFGLSHSLVRATEVVENARLREADVDPFQIAHVADVARAADAGDRENAQIVAVVENLCEIVGHLQIGIVGIGTPGDQPDGVQVGLLVPVNSHGDKMLGVADPLEIGRFVFDGFRDGIGPAIIVPAPPSAPGHGDHVLNRELAVLILQIPDILSNDRRRFAICVVHAFKIQNIGVQIAVTELLGSAVDRVERGFQSIASYLCLHALDHRDGLFPCTELGGTRGNSRQSERERQQESAEGEVHRIPPAELFFLGSCLLSAWTQALGTWAQPTTGALRLGASIQLQKNFAEPVSKIEPPIWLKFASIAATPT